jgi:hypothetical protein
MKMLVAMCMVVLLLVGEVFSQPPQRMPDSRRRAISNAQRLEAFRSKQAAQSARRREVTRSPVNRQPPSLYFERKEDPMSATTTKVPPKDSQPKVKLDKKMKKNLRKLLADTISNGQANSLGSGEFKVIIHSADVVPYKLPEEFIGKELRGQINKIVIEKKVIVR